MQVKTERERPLRGSGLGTNKSLIRLIVTALRHARGGSEREREKNMTGGDHLARNEWTAKREREREIQANAMERKSGEERATCHVNDG